MANPAFERDRRTRGSRGQVLPFALLTRLGNVSVHHALEGAAKTR